MISLFKHITLLFVLTMLSCYNFKGISIPPQVESFQIENFRLNLDDSPADLHIRFSEALRKIVREESRLINDKVDPDIIFSGAVTSYRIDYVAPEEGNTTSLNRLTIGVKVKYEDTTNEENNWEKSYNDFEDFDANANFQSIQDDLIDDIILDMVERIFNDSFTNW